MSDLFEAVPPVTDITAQIRCVERELMFRRRVYPRQVEQRKMTEGAAREEIARMEAVLKTLKSLNKPRRDPTEAFDGWRLG